MVYDQLPSSALPRVRYPAHVGLTDGNSTEAGI